MDFLADLVQAVKWTVISLGAIAIFVVIALAIVIYF